MYFVSRFHFVENVDITLLFLHNLVKKFRLPPQQMLDNSNSIICWWVPLADLRAEARGGAHPGCLPPLFSSPPFPILYLTCLFLPYPFPSLLSPFTPSLFPRPLPFPFPSPIFTYPLSASPFNPARESGEHRKQRIFDHIDSWKHVTTDLVFFLCQLGPSRWQTWWVPWPDDPCLDPPLIRCGITAVVSRRQCRWPSANCWEKWCIGLEWATLRTGFSRKSSVPKNWVSVSVFRSTTQTVYLLKFPQIQQSHAETTTTTYDVDDNKLRQYNNDNNNCSLCN